MLPNGLERSKWKWYCFHVSDHAVQDGALSDELKSGPIVFLGGLLLLITSILEFIIGNTFPCVVFGTIGKYFYLMRDLSITLSAC
jgi:succinate-acetate transporter protein